MSTPAPSEVCPHSLCSTTTCVLKDSPTPAPASPSPLMIPDNPFKNEVFVLKKKKFLAPQPSGDRSLPPSPPVPGKGRLCSSHLPSPSSAHCRGLLPTGLRSISLGNARSPSGLLNSAILGCCARVSLWSPTAFLQLSTSECLFLPMGTALGTVDPCPQALPFFLWLRRVLSPSLEGPALFLLLPRTFYQWGCYPGLDLHFFFLLTVSPADPCLPLVGHQ